MSKSHNIANLRAAVLDYISVVSCHSVTPQGPYRHNMMHVHELYKEVRGRNIRVHMLVPYNNNRSQTYPFHLLSCIFKSVHTFAYFIHSSAGNTLYADD